MVCPSEPSRFGLDPQLRESFRWGTDLPEVCRVDITDDRVWVLFPESDFVVQTRPAEGFDAVQLSFSVAVRAPEPSLETWWDKWLVSTDHGNQVAVVRREILAGRQMILRMLEEYFGTHRSADDVVSMSD
jgi:hypothetical protein